MPMHRPTSGGWVLLTGATGFLGQYLLCELLDRGHRVLAVVRAATPDQARARLVAALRPWGRDPQAAMEHGQLATLRGDALLPGMGLTDAVRQRLQGSLASVVHAAGNTTFRASPDGEPARTNVTGTAEVFQLARDCGCLDWHFVSTAFVCGRCERASEQVFADPPAFRNEYERSKWLAERDSLHAAGESGATLTIYRPSVIVGHSQTGVATRFVGVYYLFRATSLLARCVEQRGDVDRHAVPLRICADGHARPNLVFIDDVARELVDLLECPDARGGVYHLTHPDPPENLRIRETLEEHYDVSGGRFIGGGAALPDDDRSPYEDIFGGMTDAISAYVFDSPLFDRTCADRFVARRPAIWTAERLHRLIDGAERAGWRSATGSAVVAADGEGFAAYFQRFLPAHLERSKVGRLGQLNLDVRFLIESGLDSDWWCRFRAGRLIDTQRTAGRTADVTYRTSPGAFWRAVRGEAGGPELFLAGDANVEGDIERALKFAVVLEEFVREFPCNREELLNDASGTG